MARKIIIGEILNLIKGLGGNPNKFMGTKTNVSFLGKGPQESLFQGALDIEGMMKSGFPIEKVIAESEKVGGFLPEIFFELLLNFLNPLVSDPWFLSSCQ